MIAHMSKQEEQSLGALDQYANRDKSPYTQAAGNMALKTLEGEFDPTTSPMYQAVKAESMRNLKDTQAGINDQAAGGGHYWTGSRLKENREAATDVANNLDLVMAQAIEQERDRQNAMVPVAQQLGAYEEADPLRTVEALQSYGDLPRVIDQALNDAMYQEFLRTDYEAPMNVAQIAAGVQQAPLYSQVGYAPSRFQRAMQGVMSGQGIYPAFF